MRALFKLRLLILMSIACTMPVLVYGEIKPETIGQERLGEPAASWFVAKSTMGSGFVLDAASAEMLGTLSLTPWTPTFVRSDARDEVYAAEVYYSRRYGGTRDDVLTIYDHANLSPVGEIDLPDKIASLNFPQYLSLLSDGRLMTVFNMTPAQSVSVVNLEDRAFAGEISTPGCALTMAVDERGFLMICGDGTLQLIRLNADGEETKRTRSRSFFKVDDDPVFDQPVQTDTGWQLISFEGLVYEVSVEGDSIKVSKPWSVVSDDDQTEGWRVGGGQIMDLHRGLDLLYVLMHQGEVDTHEDPGSEVWVFHRDSQRRIARLPLTAPGQGILVTQDDEPRIIVSSAGQTSVQVYDGDTLKLQDTIELGMNIGTLRAY